MTTTNTAEKVDTSQRFSLATLGEKTRARRARYATQATGAAFAVLDAIADYADRYGVAFPKRKPLFVAAGVAKRTGERAIATLVKRGELLLPRANWGGHSRCLFVLAGATDEPTRERVIAAIETSRDGRQLRDRLALLGDQVTAKMAISLPYADQLKQNDRSLLSSPETSARVREASSTREKIQRCRSGSASVLAFRPNSFQRARAHELVTFFLAAFERATGRVVAGHERGDAFRVVRNVTRDADLATQKREAMAAIKGARDSPDRDRSRPLRVAYVGVDREDFIGHVQRGRLERRPPELAPTVDALERERLRQKIALLEMMGREDGDV